LSNEQPAPQSHPLHTSLQRLIGLHRQLLDAVRMERQALNDADLKLIQEATASKQALIEGIRAAETERLKIVADLAMKWKRPMPELTISEIAIAVQGYDPKFAEQLRTASNALTILISRVTDQNRDNAALVQKSLAHVEQMKRNVLGESVPRSNTYTASGNRSAPVSGARLLSKEA
jgi:flagellar biosynthesis/type III secretory pathway chaperone